MATTSLRPSPVDFSRRALVRLLAALAILAAGSAQELAAQAVADSTPGYILVANDVIAVKVFGEPDLDTTARISEDGNISMPLLISVSVRGKTAEGAARVIRDRLAERFLVNPQVSVMVVEATKRLFTVLGQVQRPGTYRFPDRSALNLPQVIGMAGGYTRLADPGRVTIKRIVGGRETVLRLNAKNMAREESSKTVEVKPGDIIEVKERLF